MYLKIGKQLGKPTGLLGRIVSWIIDIRNREIYKNTIIRLDIRSGDKIYEIGYGSGYGINRIANSGLECSINGIDFSELMVRKAAKRNRRFINDGSVKLSCGDFLTIDTENEKYNTIYCVNVIYFWKDLNKAFNKIYSMLNENGKFLIFMKHEKEIRKLKFTGEFCNYSIEEVESELLKAGFNKVEYTLSDGYYITAKKKIEIVI